MNLLGSTKSERSQDDCLEAVESLVDAFERLQKGKGVEKPTIFEQKRVRCSANWARIAEKADSPEKALTFINEAINLFPCPSYYTKRCILHLHAGKRVLAASDAIIALGLDPEFPSGYWCGAAASVSAEAYCDALNYLDKLRRCLPNSKTCTDIYVKSRNEYWETGKIQPLKLPPDISQNPIEEQYSVFTDTKINPIKLELSTSGVLESSKLTEEFVKKVIETYKRGLFHLPQKYVFMVLKNVLDILVEQTNIVHVDIARKQKVTVVGDLRGNFHNLMSIFRHTRSPQFGRPFIFNGNVIGEDKMSLPTVVILLCMKILFPDDVHIGRGSEECIESCSLNGFENEVLTVYDEDTMKGFNEIFNCLPVGHVVNNAVLVIHGGLFQNESVTLADVQQMKRAHQPPDFGPMCDILHSDPRDKPGISKEGRLRGIWFGPDVTEHFCHLNCLDYIIRSHQNVGPSGFSTQENRKCITLNSSTHYATYVVLKGNRATYKVAHARKDRHIPKGCRCFLVCKCSNGTEKEPDRLSDYVTTDLTLPTVPSDVMSVPNVGRSSSIKSSSSRVISGMVRVSSNLVEISSRISVSRSSCLKKTETWRRDGSVSSVTWQDLISKPGQSNASIRNSNESGTASLPSHVPFSPHSSRQLSLANEMSEDSPHDEDETTMNDYNFEQTPLQPPQSTELENVFSQSLAIEGDPTLNEEITSAVFSASKYEHLEAMELDNESSIISSVQEVIAEHSDFSFQ